MPQPLGLNLSASASRPQPLGHSLSLLQPLGLSLSASASLPQALCLKLSISGALLSQSACLTDLKACNSLSSGPLDWCRHDLEWHLLGWAWLTCLFFLPEMVLLLLNLACDCSIQSIEVVPVIMRKALCAELAAWAKLFWHLPLSFVPVSVLGCFLPAALRLFFAVSCLLLGEWSTFNICKFAKLEAQAPVCLPPTDGQESRCTAMGGPD